MLMGIVFMQAWGYLLSLCFKLLRQIQVSLFLSFCFVLFLEVENVN